MNMLYDDLFFSRKFLDHLIRNSNGVIQKKVLNRKKALDMLVLEPLTNDESNLAKKFPSEDFIHTRLDVVEHTFTALMICKNEEKTIEKNIAPLLQTFDYVIVVDTGSTDSTFNLLKKMQADNSNLLLQESAWCDDFSIVRNFALSFVKSGWCCFFDADEYIDNVEIESLFYLLNHLSNYKHILSCFLCPMIINGNNTTSWTTGRIFLKESTFKYKDKIHEELFRDNNFKDIRLCIKIKVIHSGYDSELRRKKITRDLRILSLALEEQPDNLKYQFYYSRENLLCHFDDKSLLLARSVLGKCSEAGLSGYEKDLLVSIMIYYCVNDLFYDFFGLFESYQFSYSNDPDLFYFKCLILLRCGEEPLTILNDVIAFKTNKPSYNHSIINFNGMHLDEIICRCLIMLKSFELARKYFFYIKQEFPLGCIDGFINFNELDYFEE